MQTLIYNANVVLPTTIVENGWLLIEDGSIRALGPRDTRPSDYTIAIDAAACFLLPGLIDLHCDMIEKLVEPRPGVRFSLALALREADLRLAGSGITTEFHAVSLDDGEFSVRSDAFVRELYQVLEETKYERMIQHKIHARLELSSQRGYAAMLEMMVDGYFDLVSLMDHSPGQGQYRTEAAYREYIARTTGKSSEEIDTFLLVKKVQAQAIPDRIKGIAHLARQLGLTIATHDDDTVAKVEQWPALGVNICEFPTTLEAAQRAHELDLAVCMGAPNVLRGRSSGGNLSALAAITAGVTDVLCSDYYPAAMLNAVFALARQHILSLPDAVRLVTLNPARAVGLDSLGSLEVGKVADLILVKSGLHQVVNVERVFVNGNEVLRRSAL
ncbi:MAG: alpha-D-ribose 1-methylphosphonate 5-triphosphate diphosphatase [Ktedonobacteraceae bacterium]|nr:alpha-D-ribose 1-methylphosphonate 5-triphosphate diphosphatase [Ktedonobacteraceae bacterium]